MPERMFAELTNEEKAKVIINERKPSPEQVIFDPTIQYLDPRDELTREERAKVVAMGDRTAVSYDNLSKIVVNDRGREIQLGGERVESTPAFFLQYALAARSSEEISHTSILEQVNTGLDVLGGDPPIVMEGVSILASLRDVCTLRHFGFEAFSSRGGVFPDGYWAVPKGLEGKPIAKEIRDVNNDIHKLYLHITEKELEYALSVTPKQEGEKLFQYKWRVLNQALDESRSITNGSFLNHLSMHPNSALSLREGVSQLAGSELPETVQIATELRNLAIESLPTLMKYTGASDYQKGLASKRREMLGKLDWGTPPSLRGKNVSPRLVSANITEDSSRVMAAAFLAEEPGMTLSAAYARLRNMDDREVNLLVGEIFTGMGTHDKPPKALEMVQVKADFIMPQGAFYEVVRHRLATHINAAVTPNYGYYMPESIVQLGLEKEFKQGIELNEYLYDKVSKMGDEYKQVYGPYFMSRAHNLPITIRMNGTDAFHMVKLRASKGAHPSIRLPISQLAQMLQSKDGAIFSHLIIKS